jgi:hypothetical protein
MPLYCATLVQIFKCVLQSAVSLGRSSCSQSLSCAKVDNLGTCANVYRLSVISGIRRDADEMGGALLVYGLLNL